MVYPGGEGDGLFPGGFGVNEYDNEESSELGKTSGFFLFGGICRSISAFALDSLSHGGAGKDPEPADRAPGDSFQRTLETLD